MTNDSGFQPIEDRVLVRLIEVEETTQGGIVIPSQTRDSANMADVHGYLVAAGEEGLTRMNHNGVQVGDLIVFAKYSGDVYIGEDGLRYRIMNAADVISKSKGVYNRTLAGRKPVSTPGT
jgi:chaperonin GroES